MALFVTVWPMLFIKYSMLIFILKPYDSDNVTPKK